MSISLSFELIVMFCFSPPKDSAGWQELLEQQAVLQAEETNRWKDVLTSSLTLIDHIKLTLHDLHASLDHKHHREYSYNHTPKEQTNSQTTDGETSSDNLKPTNS
jgi:hypothetical protein